MEDLAGHLGPERWKRTSYYAELVCHEPVNGGSATVVKAIMPWHLDGLSGRDQAAAAELINASVRYFRKLLAERNVPLARPYECLISEGRVLHLSPYVGPTVQEVIETATPVEARRLLMEVLLAMRGVLDQPEPRACGIDARLSNFCVDPSGRIVYVDLFPALCRYRDIWFVHWPNPTDPDIVQKELERKFSRLGILRRLRFDVMNVQLGLEVQLQQAILDVFSDAGEILGFFHRLPDRRLAEMKTEEIFGLIDGLTILDTDTAREIALRLIPEGPNRRGALRQVFDLSSSFSARGIPADVRIPQLKALLRSFVPAFARK
jgi:hypothetical protein